MMSDIADRLAVVGKGYDSYDKLYDDLDEQDRATRDEAVEALREKDRRIAELERRLVPFAKVEQQLAEMDSLTAPDLRGLSIGGTDERKADDE